MRVTYYVLRVENLKTLLKHQNSKVRVQIHKLPVQSTDSNSRVASSSSRVTRSTLQDKDLNSRVASSNSRGICFTEKRSSLKVIQISLARFLPPFPFSRLKASKNRKIFCWCSLITIKEHIYHYLFIFTWSFTYTFLSSQC